MARDTLKKIASALGSSYLTLIVNQMKSVLQRGYQLHVLGYTVHAMLESLQSEMKAGDLDGCVGMLMQVINKKSIRFSFIMSPNLIDEFLIFPRVSRVYQIYQKFLTA